MRPRPESGRQEPEPRDAVALRAGSIAGDCDVLLCVYRSGTFFRFPLERGLVCGVAVGFSGLPSLLALAGLLGLLVVRAVFGVMT